MTQVMVQSDVRARAKLFRSLAEPARLAILDALRTGEHSAGAVARIAGLTPSNASKHLACLRDCGLVEARQTWRHVHYRLAGDHVAHLLEEADLVLAIVAEQMAACQRPEMGEEGEP